MEKIVYLSLGSNVGDREANLRTAIEKLGELGEVIAVSSFYETEPMEFTAQPWFLNCAVALRTELMPKLLLSKTLAIEQQMGRGAASRRALARSISTFCCSEIP